VVRVAGAGGIAARILLVAAAELRSARLSTIAALPLLALILALFLVVYRVRAERRGGRVDHLQRARGGGWWGGRDADS
jgi:hypothetical protein